MQPDTAAMAGTDQPPLRPPLKWAGGKRWLVPHILPLWKRHVSVRLVEPFAGGMAVALAFQPARALVNDANPHLINFFRWLQKGLHLTIPAENDEALFYHHRAQFNSLLSRGEQDSCEAAQLFYFLNRTGYNGLCRFNRSGEFNVPFGRYRTINYLRDFSPYAEALSAWELTSGDFAALALEPDDFVYADPPYDVEFRQYSPDGFEWADQVRLAEWLARHAGPVVLSNQATDRIVELYRETGFRLEFLDAPRMIACNGDRTKAREVIATRNL